MTDETNKAMRWRPWQFSLRTMLTLIALAALFLWGGRYYRGRIEEHKQVEFVVAKIQSWTGDVTYEIPKQDGQFAGFVQSIERTVFGEEFITQPAAVTVEGYSARVNSELRDALAAGAVDVVPTISELPSVRRLKLSGIPLNEKNLTQLGSMAQLEVLYLDNNHIEGNWLPCLKNLTKLKQLALRMNKIKDEDLRHLAGLTELEELHLDFTMPTLTGEGLGHLANLRNLEMVSLNKIEGYDGRLTGRTRASIKTLKESLPYCEIRVTYHYSIREILDVNKR